ncbi:NUDIX domain-containing protein [Isoptericola halotolerans]|uniref:ADP-ribose pyrophosphatase YjhB (NUDIX family) n=1 Tax=Isoptericola halotolerans TaxID=300560 RepID=A0ABX2A362_9MICO|nr:NUDIX domain-containing protein [Isoptericola halotolerans]NOV97146.1 ADP-ribose pyrophosphatase YjhB (NUDIX family) [Isoptericola halotolerans]
MPIPDHVASLRTRVGTDLLWLPGVSAVVRDGDHRLLLGRRTDNGRWALPSGILDPGEQPAAGIVREVLEETAVEIEVVEVVGIFSTPVIVYPNGDRSAYLDTLFRACPVSPAAARAARVADDESSEVGWFGAHELPADLADSTRERLAHERDFLAATDRAALFERP